jgi:phosphatidylglycerophosphatase A
VAVVLYYFSPLVAGSLFHRGDPDLLVFLLLLAVSFFVGIWAANVISSPSNPDPRGFVWDEFVGMWVTCLLLDKHVMMLAIAFAAFRFFDVVKPFPIRRLERLPGGLGIMADDLLAGIYGAVLCNLSWFVLFVTARI